ncbi:FERM, ARHGEF and pleckstrin domain-containing protein 1 isoform X2 [Bombyx mori]|uniref:Moesin/ezrin/radixin homolog 1 n=1 Tax=Bombyx mori TaxID=7091 RepID=A0A8R2CA64_BOMMO|nr:FERM, ARHGEF and pleckstrin domain-containing protein 1 isoform X2 [Bombyx mori]
MMDSELPPGSCNSTGHLSTIGYHTLPGRMHHSASTPAGVDGAGGGSRTPPATPKKGGKMLAVRVQMLDDTISMFQIQSKALGRVLFDQVCRQLHLLEADYFGLEYQDSNGTKYWLDVEKPMCRQVGLSMLEPTLRFCVKFYTPDPARLEEEFTRYLFCLQVKRDLAQGCIQCNENTAALMASYIVQAECGDFVPEDYPDHTYLSGYKFFPSQDSESERRIMENHKKHIGQSPAEADLNLLETARRCELYGIKIHSTKDHEGVPLNLAVAHMGIVVFQNYTKINTFSWAKIRKISFKRKKFLIKLHPEGYGYYRDVVEFFFEGRNECKNFWKKCVENHGFFRCSSVPRLPRHKTRVISRGSSFRYSGKTQKQIVEFVRDNYVKRQTFQRFVRAGPEEPKAGVCVTILWRTVGRSGSFRATRVASGALPSSLSAHPLLPLPPGSDAISLEWDKQPHYLEASLMMKGYSAEEARAAAERARCRPPAVRPPLQATAYVNTRDKLTKQYCSQIVAPELVTRAEVNHHPMEDSPLLHRTTTPSDSPESTWRRQSVSRARAAPAPPPRTDELSPEDDNTLSSASLCMSPSSTCERDVDPTSASAACALAMSNGHDALDSAHPKDVDKNATSDVINGNVNVNIVSESTNSMEVLSGGESDTGDTLTRKNNNSISSNILGTLKEEGGHGAARRRSGDVTYFVAKELLMTERTYKRDLEYVTVTWGREVSALAGAGGGGEAGAGGVLARACLALEPLALPAGAFLHRLERALTASPAETEEPEYRRIAEYLYDYLSSTADAYGEYVERAGSLAALVESVRRRSAPAASLCARTEHAAPLLLPCLLLRPLHRLLHYHHLAQELCKQSSGPWCSAALETAGALAEAARQQLQHGENHATLCHLQRHVAGYDKLLVADREFLRMGCVYKHSSRGLLQRMLFLFNDVLIEASKSGGVQFRAHAVRPLRALRVRQADAPFAFALADDDQTLVFNASNEREFEGWFRTLDRAIQRAHDDDNTAIDTQLTPYEMEVEDGTCASGGGGLAHVCWHRATSLSRDQLHLAMRTQLSGYLLRKFKKSPGWQKLWVVFAVFTLFFYKSWQDDTPLASLPLLGYSVGPPSSDDGIEKDFVFKLHYKNHVYFFRADSYYTYNRWTEVLQTAMLRNI